jgi:septum formation protein
MTTRYKNLDVLLKRHRLVLASGSPRRVQLLREAGIDFRQVVPEIDERDDPGIDPSRLAVLLAVRKAEAVKGRIERDEIILGCDTIVILDDKILGKPESKKEAVQMLSSLSGQKHTVCTAIALLSVSGEIVEGFESTDVYFRTVSSRNIEKYVETDEPLDKAGAYGIQERGVFLVDSIRGNIDNVIGLPMTLLDELAGKLARIKGLYGF